MDLLSAVGIIIGVAAIVGGNMLDGGQIHSLIHITAFVIVIGGTFGAIMLQTPLAIFSRGLRIAPWVLFPPKIGHQETIDEIVEWSKIARREGLLGLEELIDEERHHFSKRGLQLLVDGSEPDSIRDILEVELAAREHSEIQAAKVYEGMGGYCPTIGILGAVMGLIQVMNNLADPGKLGEGIAVAFVATIYGVGFANLLFLPMSSKLKSLIRRQAQFDEMIMEGVIAISEGENPRNIEIKLQGYIE